MDILTYINRMNQIYGNGPAPAPRYNTQQYLQGGRVGYKEGDIVKAGELKKVFSASEMDISSKNLSRAFTKYGIEKVSSGRYVEPSTSTLKKIKKQFDINELRAPMNPKAKAAAKVRKERIIELLETGEYNRNEINEIVKKEFKHFKDLRETISNLAKDFETPYRDRYSKLGINMRNKLIKNFPNIKFNFDSNYYGVSPKHSSYGKIKTATGAIKKYRKKRGSNIADISSKQFEKEARIDKKGSGTDLAHRTSLSESAKQKLLYKTSSLGIDDPLVNREKIKPIETELKKLYKQRAELVKNVKPNKVPIEIQKKLSDINFKISNTAAKTDGVLNAILLDEKTLKPIETGKNYAKSADLGVVDKNIQNLTKKDKAVYLLNQREQVANLIEKIGCGEEVFATGGRVSFKDGSTCYTRGVEKIKTGKLTTAAEKSNFSKLTKMTGGLKKLGSFLFGPVEMGLLPLVVAGEGLYANYADKRDLKKALDQMDMPQEEKDAILEGFRQEARDVGSVGLETYAIDQPNVDDKLAEKFRGMEGKSRLYREVREPISIVRQQDAAAEQLKKQEIEKRTKEAYEDAIGRSSKRLMEYDKSLPDIFEEDK